MKNNDIDIQELKRLHAAATPGEWFINDHMRDEACLYIEAKVANHNHIYVGMVTPETQQERDTAQYIAALNNAFPALIARLEAAEAAMQWRPIEEAPSNAALRVGVWADDGDGGNRSWFSPSGWYEKNQAIKQGYTHYFIIPAPPEAP